MCGQHAVTQASTQERHAILTDRLAEVRPQRRVHLLRLRGRGDLAGADRPDGLIRDDDVRPVRGGEQLDGRVRLRAADLERLARLALLERLADAEDDLEACGSVSDC